jgi:hypothetical protein
MMRQLIYILLFNAKHYLYEKGHIRTRPELMYREPDIARRGDWVQLAFPWAGTFGGSAVFDRGIGRHFLNTANV